MRRQPRHLGFSEIRPHDRPPCQSHELLESVIPSCQGLCPRLLHHPHDRDRKGVIRRRHPSRPPPSRYLSGPPGGTAAPRSESRGRGRRCGRRGPVGAVRCVVPAHLERHIHHHPRAGPGARSGRGTIRCTAIRLRSPSARKPPETRSAPSSVSPGLSSQMAGLITAPLILARIPRIGTKTTSP